MPAASFCLRHSARGMRVVSTSVAWARSAPTVASSLGVCANGSQSKNRQAFSQVILWISSSRAARVLELLPGELGRLRPRRVGVGVVALPGDDVDADAVAQQQAGRVGDVAGEDVLAEHLGRQLAAEVVAVVQPGLVLEVAVDAVEVEGDPADAALGQRDLEVGELRAASGRTAGPAR